MAWEVERKFLVKNLSFKQFAKGIFYQQGYLSSGNQPTVRVRIAGLKGYITVKGPSKGFSRSEYEYEIPYQDAQEMLRYLCMKPLIEKYRYKLEYEGFVWEIDEFKKENEGLVVAEIELDNEEITFAKPDFIGDEVTFESRYRNASLVNHPYKSW